MAPEPADPTEHGRVSETVIGRRAAAPSQSSLSSGLPAQTPPPPPLLNSRSRLVTLAAARRAALSQVTSPGAEAPLRPEASSDSLPRAKTVRFRPSGASDEGAPAQSDPVQLATSSGAVRIETDSVGSAGSGAAPPWRRCRGGCWCRSCSRPRLARATECPRLRCTALGLLPVSAGLFLALLLALWAVKVPGAAEGAFGSAFQVALPQVVWRATLERARRAAVAMRPGPTTPDGSHPGEGGLHPGHSWRRVFLVYESSGGDVVSKAVLAQVQQLEKQVRELPAWRRLCLQTPQDVRRLCELGDTLAAAYYANVSSATPAQKAQGLLQRARFDGGGEPGFLELSNLVWLLEATAPDVLWWRLAQGEARTRALRSTFAFYLAAEAVAEEWPAFVRDELEPLLRRLAWELEDSETEELWVRLFYSFDGEEEVGLGIREFEEAFDREWEFVASGFVLAPLSAAVAVLVMTRRMFLAFATSFVAFSAPFVASMLLEERGSDGVTRVPAIAFAAWATVMSGCVDSAAGCAAYIQRIREPRQWKSSLETFQEELLEGSALSRLLRRCRGRCRLRSWLQRQQCFDEATVLLLREALAPALVSGLLLCALPANGDGAVVAMVRDFSRHAGLGLVLAAGFSGLLCPGVVALGDLLKARIGEVSFSSRWLQVAYHNVMPLELGGEPQWRSTLHTRATLVVRLMVGSLHVRLLLLLLALAALVAAAVGGGPDEWDGGTPRLFSAGHRIQDGPEVWALFGPLPGPMDMLSATPAGASICEPGALYGDCQLHACEADGSAAAADRCKCYSSAQAPNGAACAVAKVWGLNQTESLDRTAFWSWAAQALVRQGALGAGAESAASNSSRSALRSSGPLEILDWGSGQTSMALCTGTALSSGGDIDAEAAEALGSDGSCARVLCFCGQRQCSQAGLSSAGAAPAWPLLGTTERAAIVERAAPSAAAEEASEAVDLVWAWGLAPGPVPSRSMRPGAALSFNSAALEDLGEQRRLFSFCAGTAPGLEIAGEGCWLLDFQRWIGAVQERPYPAPKEEFYLRVSEFLQEHTLQVPLRDRAQQFLVGDGGRISGFVMTFTLNASVDQTRDDDLMSRWGEYAALRGLPPPNSTSPASQRAVDEQAARAIRSLCGAVAAQAVALAGLGALLATLSLGIAVAVSAALACALGFLFSVLVAPSAGSLDVVSLQACLVSVSVPLLRVAQLYATCQDVPPAGARQMGVRCCRWPWHRSGEPATGADAATRAGSPHSSSPGARGSTRSPPGAQSPKTAFKNRSKSVFEQHDLPGQSARPVPVPLWVGACNAERRMRCTVAISCGAEVILCTLLSTLFVGTMLMSTSMEGLGRAGVAILVAGVVAVPVALLLLPELLVLGLGQSRVQDRALVHYVAWLWRRRGPTAAAARDSVEEDPETLQGWWRSDELVLTEIRPGRSIVQGGDSVGRVRARGAHSVCAEFDGVILRASIIDGRLEWGNGEVWTRAKDVDRSKEDLALLSAQVLGFKYPDMGPLSASCSWLSSCPTSRRRAARRSEDENKNGARADAPLQGVLTLQVPHGASAMPPYHMVSTVVRDVNFKG